MPQWASGKIPRKLLASGARFCQEALGNAPGFLRLALLAWACLFAPRPALAAKTLRAPSGKVLADVLLKGIRGSTVDFPGTLCANRSANAEVAKVSFKQVRLIKQSKPQKRDGMTLLPVRLKLQGSCAAWVAGSTHKTQGRFEVVGDFDLLPQKGGKWKVELRRWHPVTLKVKALGKPPAKKPARKPAAKNKPALSPSKKAVKKPALSDAQRLARATQDALLLAATRGLLQKVHDEQEALLRLAIATVSDYTFRQTLSAKNEATLPIAAREFAFRLNTDHVVIMDDRARVLAHVTTNRSKSGEERFAKGKYKKGKRLPVHYKLAQQAIDTQQAFKTLSLGPGREMKAAVIVAVPGPVSYGALMLQNKIGQDVARSLKGVFMVHFVLAKDKILLSSTLAKNDRTALQALWKKSLRTSMARAQREAHTLRLNGRLWRARYIGLGEGFAALALSPLAK